MRGGARGFYGLKPRELRKLVEDQGMRISSSPRGRGRRREPPRSDRHAGELGVKLAAAVSASPSFKDMAAIRATAEKVNLMDERLRAAD